MKLFLIYQKDPTTNKQTFEIDENKDLDGWAPSITNSYSVPAQKNSMTHHITTCHPKFYKEKDFPTIEGKYVDQNFRGKASIAISLDQKPNFSSHFKLTDKQKLDNAITSFIGNNPVAVSLFSNDSFKHLLDVYRSCTDPLHPQPLLHGN